MMQPRWRVLIADDDADSRDLYGFALSHFGFDVTTAVDGHQAALLAMRPPLPHLVVLDLRMPGLDGFQVFDVLRNNPETAAVPVIGLSGDVRHKQEALDRGFVKFCSKPCPPDQLVLEVVATLLPAVTATRPADEVVRVQQSAGGRWWDVLWRGEMQSRWPSEFAARDAARVAAERYRAPIIN